MEHFRRRELASGPSGEQQEEGRVLTPCLADPDPALAHTLIVVVIKFSRCKNEIPNKLQKV